MQAKQTMIMRAVTTETDWDSIYGVVRGCLDAFAQNKENIHNQEAKDVMDEIYKAVRKLEKVYNANTQSFWNSPEHQVFIQSEVEKARQAGHSWD